MKTAGFYCALVNKVTVIKEQPHTKPVSVVVTVGHCDPATKYERQMELLAEVNATSFPIGISLDEYLEKYTHSKARRLF